MQLISKFIKGIRFLLCTIDIDKGGPKFKVSDHVRITRYNNIFSNWSEEVFMIKKVKNTVPWAFAINHLKDEEIFGTFYEKQLQKTNQKVFRVEKVIKRKGDKLHLKWKG